MVIEPSGPEYTVKPPLLKSGLEGILACTEAIHGELGMSVYTARASLRLVHTSWGPTEVSVSAPAATA